MCLRDGVLMCRSGLRGAVGLALALFVYLDDSIADRRFRVLTFFFMGAAALLTLMVQGTTMPALLRVRADVIILPPPPTPLHFGGPDGSTE